MKEIEVFFEVFVDWREEFISNVIVLVLCSQFSEYLVILNK